MYDTGEISLIRKLILRPSWLWSRRFNVFGCVFFLQTSPICAKYFQCRFHAWQSNNYSQLNDHQIEVILHSCVLECDSHFCSVSRCTTRWNDPFLSNVLVFIHNFFRNLLCYKAMIIALIIVYKNILLFTQVMCMQLCNLLFLFKSKLTFVDFCLSLWSFVFTYRSLYLYDFVLLITSQNFVDMNNDCYGSFSSFLDYLLAIYSNMLADTHSLIQVTLPWFIAYVASPWVLCNLC